MRLYDYQPSNNVLQVSLRPPCKQHKNTVGLTDNSSTKRFSGWATSSTPQERSWTSHIRYRLVAVSLSPPAASGFSDPTTGLRCISVTGSTRSASTSLSTFGPAIWMSCLVLQSSRAVMRVGAELPSRALPICCPSCSTSSQRIECRHVRHPRKHETRIRDA